MNPSAAGWIPKYLTLLENDGSDGPQSFGKALNYQSLRTIGFVYGISVKSFLQRNPSKLTLTHMELSKVNLFHLLLASYLNKHPNRTAQEALSSIIAFYKSIEKDNKKFLRIFTGSQRKSTELEDILAARINETNALFKKNFTSLLTHAFLFVDVLAFTLYMDRPTKAKEYCKEIEGILLRNCLMAIHSKAKKNKHDRQLLELFEDSVTFIADEKVGKNDLDFLGKKQFTENEKYYILDLACIAVWDDHNMDASEQQFLYALCEQLRLPDEVLSTSIESIVLFTTESAKRIKLFNNTNPVNQAYKHATVTVKTLILRNRKRLITELEESGELMVLLGKSTTRELNTSEKQKVKEQLLDICKTIPSLTIFLLPGGTLLLPILVKLIPQLLPSAFDDNRIKKKK